MSTECECCGQWWGAEPCLDADGESVLLCEECAASLRTDHATVCNCTQDGLPYCGRPDCDVDWCQDCGDEYTEPCARHEEVGRP